MTDNPHNRYCKNYYHEGDLGAFAYTSTRFAQTSRVANTCRDWVREVRRIGCGPGGPDRYIIKVAFTGANNRVLTGFG